MKPIASPIALLESERTSLPGDDSATGKGGEKGNTFDAVLALVAAQVATLTGKAAPAPVPTSGAVPAAAQVDAAPDAGQTTGLLRSPLQAGLAGQDIAPFQPWLTQGDAVLPPIAPVDAPVRGQMQAVPAESQPVALRQSSDAENVMEPRAGERVSAAGVADPAATAHAAPVVGQAGQPSASRATAPEEAAQPWSGPAAKHSAQPAELGFKSAPAPSSALHHGVHKAEQASAPERAQAGRSESLEREPRELRAEPVSTLQQSADARLLAHGVSAPVTTPAQTRSTPRTPEPLLASEPRTVSKGVAHAVHSAPAVQTQSFAVEQSFALPFLEVGEQLAPAAPLDARASELQADMTKAGPELITRGLVQSPSLPVGETATSTQSDSALEAQLTSDPRVRVEFLEAAAEGAAQGEPTDGAAPREPSEAAVDHAAQGEQAGQGDAQQQSSEHSQEQPRGSAQQAQVVPTFQVTEAQGARGIDAVVASLLRSSAHQDTTQLERAGARGGLRSAAVQSVQGGEQSAGLARVAQLANEQRAQRSREEERLLSHELLGDPGLSLSAHVETPRAVAPAEPSQAPAPVLRASVLLPDADAAAMGKLARGEGVQAANISIDHPELGAMDLMVEHENGRVDVRATLQTPRAAAVLRAHESALRYGIQQAGMTFGALRVRARTEGGQTVRAQSNSNVGRRRDHDWEA